MHPGNYVVYPQTYSDLCPTPVPALSSSHSSILAASLILCLISLFRNSDSWLHIKKFILPQFFLFPQQYSTNSPGILPLLRYSRIHSKKPGSSHSVSLFVRLEIFQVFPFNPSTPFYIFRHHLHLSHHLLSFNPQNMFFYHSNTSVWHKYIFLNC